MPKQQRRTSLMTIHNRNSRRAPTRRAGAVSSLVFAGIVLSALQTPASAETKVVRLGYQYSLWGAPAVVALELGLFKKHGIEVDAKRFGAGKDARDGLVFAGIVLSALQTPASAETKVVRLG